MRREAQSVVLVLLGGVTLRLELSGEYLNYVRATLGPYLLVVGVVLLALGAVSFVRDWRGREAALRADHRSTQARIRTHGPGAAEPDQDEDEHGDHGDGEHGDGEHEHGDDGHGVGWLWCVPIFVLLLVPPPALGSYAAARGGTAVPRPAPADLPGKLSGADPISLSVHDYALRAIWASSTLSDHTVVLTGFVTPNSGGDWYLTRMKISCCAADARPFEVQVSGTSGLHTADSWVEVIGRWLKSTGSDQADAVPRIQAIRVRDVGTPREPYE